MLDHVHAEDNIKGIRLIGKRRTVVDLDCDNTL